MRARWFTCGYLAGVITALAMSAMAARLVGGNGYLQGWEVTVGGEAVCFDLYVHAGTREIECD